MPIPVFWLTPPGKLVPAHITADNLDEVGRREPDGIYTITRTFQSNRTVLLDAHMDRLEQSARLESIPFILNRSWLRAGLRQLIQQTGYPESRFRITIPRATPQRALLAIEPLAQMPESMRMTGVSAVTVCIDRPNPQAKSNRWVQQRDLARKELPAWAYEGLVCTVGGQILEGFSSNFYALQAGRLFTARDIVLSGIARKILLEVCEGLVEVCFDPITRQETASLDEALLTSSSRGVVPIVRIDSQVIGDGTPGPLTLHLWQRYQRWVEERLETI